MGEARGGPRRYRPPPGLPWPPSAPRLYLQASSTCCSLQHQIELGTRQGIWREGGRLRARGPEPAWCMGQGAWPRRQEGGGGRGPLCTSLPPQPAGTEPAASPMPTYTQTWPLQVYWHTPFRCVCVSEWSCLPAPAAFQPRAQVDGAWDCSPHAHPRPPPGEGGTHYIYVHSLHVCVCEREGVR